MKYSRLIRICLFLILFAHTAIYHIQITMPRHARLADFIQRLHSDTINGTGSPPYIHRVLVPALLSPMIDDTPYSVVYAYTIGDVIATCTMLFFLFYWSKKFVNEPLAWVGVYLTGYLLPNMMNAWMWSVSTPVEVSLFVLALFSMKRRWLFAGILILATLNRNSSIVLVAWYAANTISNWKDLRQWVPVAGYSALWAVIYGALLATRHETYLWILPGVTTLDASPQLLASLDDTPINLRSDAWPTTLLNNAVLLPLFVLAYLGCRHHRLLRRQAIWGVAVYLPPILYYAIWSETRLWLPMFPILLPLALLSIQSYTSSASVIRD